MDPKAGDLSEAVREMQDAILGSSEEGLMRAAWFWIDRWRQSSAYCDLSAEAQGCFRNLLDELWLRDGTLPFEDKSLAKSCGDFEAWPRVRDAVLSRFYRTPGGWRNATHDEVSAESSRRAKKQASYRADRGNKAGNKAGNETGNKAALPAALPGSFPERLPNVPSSPSPDPDPFKGSVSNVTTDYPETPETSAPTVAVSRDTWLTPYIRAWTDRFEGMPATGPLSKLLRPLELKYGSGEVLSRWVRYLSQAEASFASPARFASTFGDWGHVAHGVKATTRSEVQIVPPTAEEIENLERLKEQVLGR